MSIRYFLECAHCQNVSPEVGNDGFTGKLGFCPDCRQIAVRNPNRQQDPAVCSACGVQAPLQPLVRGGQEVTEPHREQGMDCPWCGASETLRSRGHSIGNPGFSRPEPGDVVHCRIIGRCDEGYVGVVNCFSYLIVSGAEDVLHSLCEVVAGEERFHAVFRQRLADSGDGLLDTLEISYEDEPCLLLDAGGIARLVAVEPLQHWDLWQFSVGLHTAKRPPEEKLVSKMRFWTIDMSTLFRLGSRVSDLAHLWHPVEKRWLSLDQVKGTVGFADGSQVEWAQPWENSAVLAQRTANGPWKLTLRDRANQVLWDFSDERLKDR